MTAILGIVAAAHVEDEASGSSQEPVALVAADGESIDGDSQSNFTDEGFYTRMGYTRAAAWTGGGFAGFDDVDFIPISIWLLDTDTTTFYARMDDLGINGMLPAAGSITLTNNITYGKWAVVPDSSWAGGTITTGEDPGVIGVSTGEEPSTDTHYETILADAATWLASSDGPGRMHQFNFADNLLNGDIDSIYYPDDMVIAGDWTTCDQYWIAGASTGFSGAKLAFRLYPGLGVDGTETQTARGSHYGSMMDCIRKAFGGDRRPFGCWVENGAPYTEEESLAITPTQLKWAIWSTIVHGARGIYYFNHTFRIDDPLISTNNFNNNGYGGPGITGTGIYAAAKEVNLNALSVASVINSPFDGYLCFGDGEADYTDIGFLTACTSTNTRNYFSGVDASCRWQPVEGRHYIFATTREQSGTTSWPVTFRMVDQGQTEAVRLFDTTGTITITRGGSIPAGFCEFVDTFAIAQSYKCYRID